MRSVNWFREWSDAVCTADFRASLTRFKYRVFWEPENSWWSIRETAEPVVDRDESGGLPPG